jgi:hypothetical protein
VAGKVSGLPEGAKNVFVQMMRATPGGGAQGAQGGQVKPDGSFEIWRPNPGKYIVRAQFNDSGDVTASGGVEVEVGDADVDNIGLRLLPAEEIRGRLEFDDEMAKQGPQEQGRPGAQGTPAGQGTSQAPPPRPQ